MLAVLLLIAALAAVAPAAETAGTAPPRALATGDSMVQPLDEQLGKPVKRAGGRVRRDPRPGTGVSKPLVLDWVKHARRQVDRYRPTVTVMFIGANDFFALRDEDGREVQCCRRSWIDAYARRAASMMTTYKRRTAHVYWLNLPASRDGDHRRRMAAVNLGIAQAAEAAGERVHVVDTAGALTPGFEYRRRMRYRGELVVVRDRDGIHLTAAGARVVRDLVVGAMRDDGLLG